MTIWIGQLDGCNCCNKQFSKVTVMYDANLPRMGWGNWCHGCFTEYGGKLGTGRGQKYKRNADGKFEKVEG